MRFKQVGNKRDIVAMTIHNADTVQIPLGTPVVLAMNGTNDGLDVVLPSTANSDNLSQAFWYGVADRTLNVGDYGEAFVFGIYNNIVLEIRTRAGTSGGSSWSSVSSIPQGCYLSLDTANNCFTTQVSTYGAVTASTAAAAATYTYSPKAVLNSSFASLAGVATSSSDTRTVSTVAVAAFIRML
jgi:hypothetical protein